MISFELFKHWCLDLKKAATISLLAVVVLVPAMSATVMAAGGTLYVESASGPVMINDRVTASVHLDTGEENAKLVQFSVAFDPTKFELLSLDTASSAFPVNQTTRGTGIINFNGTSTAEPKSGDLALLTLSFKSLAGSGSTSVNITGARVLNAANADILNSFMGKTYNFTSPVKPAATVATPASPGSGRTVRSTSTPSATTATIPPAVDPGVTVNTGTNGAMPALTSSTGQDEQPALLNVYTPAVASPASHPRKLSLTKLGSLVVILLAMVGTLILIKRLFEPKPRSFNDIVYKVVPPLGLISPGRWATEEELMADNLAASPTKIMDIFAANTRANFAYLPYLPVREPN